MKVVSVRRSKQQPQPGQPAKKSLYDIATEFAEDVTRLADADLPDEVINDTLEGMRGDLEVKMASLAAVIKNLEAEEKAVGEAVGAMERRRVALDKRIDKLKAYAILGLDIAGVEEVRTDQLVIRAEWNPPAVEVFDPSSLSLVAPEFMVTPPAPQPRPDKKAIKEAIESGKEVPGCRLTRSKRLSIK